MFSWFRFQGLPRPSQRPYPIIVYCCVTFCLSLTAVFFIVLSNCAFTIILSGWVNNFAPLFQSISRNPETNVNLHTSIFRRFEQVTCNCFEFWMGHRAVLLPFLLVRAILPVLLTQHSNKSYPTSRSWKLRCFCSCSFRIQCLMPLDLCTVTSLGTSTLLAWRGC